jgi:hypothetical protein
MTRKFDEPIPGAIWGRGIYTKGESNERRVSKFRNNRNAYLGEGLPDSLRLSSRHAEDPVVAEIKSETERLLKEMGREMTYEQYVERDMEWVRRVRPEQISFLRRRGFPC